MKVAILSAVLASVIFFAASAWPQNEQEGATTRGKKAYESLCMGCHGKTGEGNGRGAGVMGVQVGDLSNKAYMDLLTDEDLYERISYGEEKFPYIQMPAWSKYLSADAIKDVVAYIRTIEKDKGPLKVPSPQEKGERFKKDPLYRGNIYYTRFCSTCHGQSGDGKGRAAERLAARPASFKDAAFVNSLTHQQILDYIHGKITKDGRNMPVFRAFKEEMVDDILHYIRTLPDKQG